MNTANRPRPSGFTVVVRASDRAAALAALATARVRFIDDLETAMGVSLMVRGFARSALAALASAGVPVVETF